MKKPQSINPTRAERLLRPFQEFMHKEASGGILLLVFTVIALIWANSPFADRYVNLWQTQLTIGIGSFVLAKPLLLWINDGLMAVFFFVVGLEIKREVLVGELASLRQAALPLLAAVGGMLVPALIYAAFNSGKAGASGWGIPMATDIAFALGVMALLGKRAPLPLKIFLTALAIVDDIGAVLVIALFYTAEISWLSLAAAAVFLILLVIVNRLGVRHPLVYTILGIGLWVAFLKSGIHATVAGVLLAMTIPTKARIKSKEFVKHGRVVLGDFERAEDGLDTTNGNQQAALQELETIVKRTSAPLQRMEHALHPWVAFFIMPVFAFANAGVAFGDEFVSAFTNPITLGVVAGLVIGKQVGITAFAWLAVKGKLADLPVGVTWLQIYGASCLAGIGFTMSLFIAGLAFGDSPALSTAKVGILAASLIAGFLGWIILRNSPQK
ncbi:MAG: Na+/H+ antiporter NhaA [Chloroflexi bacterium HGW-Chloroflexi-10]|nr:MAG: Na+/H+ antiporter NhaA [Chloroflexi bacterium HGW-Chloroflexi-10]